MGRGMGKVRLRHGPDCSAASTYAARSCSSGPASADDDIDAASLPKMVLTSAGGSPRTEASKDALEDQLGGSPRPWSTRAFRLNFEKPIAQRHTNLTATKRTLGWWVRVGVGKATATCARHAAKGDGSTQHRGGTTRAAEGAAPGTTRQLQSVGARRRAQHSTLQRAHPSEFLGRG